MSRCHAAKTIALRIIKHSHNVITFAAQPFHWGGGGHSREGEVEVEGWNRNTKSKREK